LEIAWAGLTRLVGSNPTLSAQALWAAHCGVIGVSPCRALPRPLFLAQPFGSARAGYRVLKFVFAHLRASFDAELLRVVVELLTSAATGTFARLFAAATCRRAPTDRAARGTARFARPCLFLVDGPSSDFLSPLRRTTGLLLALFDVFVLALSFAAFFDSAWGHLDLLSVENPTRTPRRIAVGLRTQAGTGTLR